MVPSLRAPPPGALHSHKPPPRHGWGQQMRVRWWRTLPRANTIHITIDSMSEKFESKELTTADELTSFWDRYGGAWLGSVLASSESIGLGVHMDEYTDTLRIRFDGTVQPGKQRIVRHNFTEAQADPSNFKE